MLLTLKLSLGLERISINSKGKFYPLWKFLKLWALFLQLLSVGLGDDYS